MVLGLESGVSGKNGSVESGSASEFRHESGSAAVAFTVASSRHTDIRNLEDTSYSSQVSAEATRDGMLSVILICYLRIVFYVLQRVTENLD